MGFVVGMMVAVGCILGGFAAMGGQISVIWQPWEFIIICGASLGTFIVANPLSTIKDTGLALLDAIFDRAPGQRSYLDVLGVLYSLMREMRGKARNEVEQHVDSPSESSIFKGFPRVLTDEDLTHFICATREQRCRSYIIVKQTLLAFMNGAMPQIALEHGRKTISSHDRPSIDMVENETVSGGAGNVGMQQAA